MQRLAHLEDGTVTITASSDVELELNKHYRYSVTISGELGGASAATLQRKLGDGGFLAYEESDGTDEQAFEILVPASGVVKLAITGADGDTELVVDFTRVSVVSDRSLSNENVNDALANDPAASRAALELSEVDNTSDADKPVSNATQAELDEKADSTVRFMDRFGRLANGTTFAHNTIAPEISPFGNWRMHLNGGVPTAPTIENGAVRGGTNTLYYLGGPIGEEITSLSVEVEWRKSVTYPTGTSSNAVFVLALASSTMLDEDGGEITLPENMVHLEMSAGGINGLGMGEGGVVFDAITPEGSGSPTVAWDDNASFPVMQFGKKYVIRLEIDRSRNELRVITPFGKTWKYTDARIGAAAYTDFYFEAIGDSRDGSPLDRYCTVHRIWVNAPQLDRAPGWGTMPNTSALSELISGGNPSLAVARLDLPGPDGGAVPGIAGTERFAIDGDSYTYGKISATPFSGGRRGRVPMVHQTISAAVASGASASSEALQTLYDSNLPTDGDSITYEIRGTFGANGNDKRIQIESVGIGNWFDSGVLTENGTGWVLTFTTIRSSESGIARRLSGEFRTSATSKVINSTHPHGGSWDSIFRVTGTAAGDVTITSLCAIHYPAGF